MISARDCQFAWRLGSRRICHSFEKPRPQFRPPRSSANFAAGDAKTAGYVPEIIDLLLEGPGDEVFSMYESVGGERVGLSGFGASQTGERRFGGGGRRLQSGDGRSRERRRGDVRVRAKASEESGDYGEGYGSGAGKSVWDSNAENIRRPKAWKKSNTSRAPKAPSRWDYDAEPEVEAEPKAFRPFLMPWQWWSAEDDDEVDEDEEYDDDEESEDPFWMEWLSGDLREAFMYFRWGLPAFFLLSSALIPTMLGNPFLLLLGFTVLPSIAKYLNPFSKGFFGSLFNPANNASRRRQQQRRAAAARSPPPTPQSDWDTSPQNGVSSSPVRKNMEEDLGVTRVQSDLGGWELLEADRSRSKSRSMWQKSKRRKSG